MNNRRRFLTFSQGAKTQRGFCKGDNNYCHTRQAKDFLEEGLCNKPLRIIL